MEKNSKSPLEGVKMKIELVNIALAGFCVGVGVMDEGKIHSALALLWMAITVLWVVITILEIVTFMRKHQ